MSWRYLQGREEVFSEAIFWDGKQFAPSKLNNTLSEYCLLDNGTGSSHASQYGMTLRRLTGPNGGDVLTWYQGDSPVRTYRPLVKGSELTAPEVDSGPSSLGSLAKYNPGSRSWRTRQYLLRGGLKLYSGTWPRWGMMQNGECWARPQWVPTIIEPEYGWLPTPRETQSRVPHFRKHRGLSFSNANLEEVLTSKCPMLEGHRIARSGLNRMMIWPDGWAKCRPLEMDRFRRWLRSHGEFCRKE